MQYRHLEAGEIIQAGDEIDRCRDAWRDDAVWEPVHPDNYGEPAPDPKYPSHRQYRRPISEQALGRIERAIKGQEKHPDEAGFGQDVCLNCGWDKGGEIPEELVKRSETGEALCPECNEVCHYFDYREEHLEHKKACSELHMAVSPFGVDCDPDNWKFIVYEKASRKTQAEFDDSQTAFNHCALLNDAYAAMKRGQQKAQGPSRQWLESMAKVEGKCPSVSVGGMACDLGLVALKAVRDYGSRGETTDGVSVSYLVDEAISVAESVETADRPKWIDEAAKACAEKVLVGAGADTFANIIERHFKRV